MQKNLFISLFAMTIATHCGAQALEPSGTQVLWGVSGGMNHYKEPDLMQLKGPEVGLHSRITRWAGMPNAQFEGDILLGKQKYTSVSSGSMNGVTNFETRWRALVPVFSDTPTNEGLFAGLALHTLWNDLRGTSTFNGQTFGGYERSARQLWLPLRWSSGDMWEVDGGLLIYGRHTSKLSDVNARNDDVTNTQRRGQYAQVSMNLKQSSGYTLTPFVRYTRLADSNIVPNREYDSRTNSIVTVNRYEPASQRWQIGAVWEFR